MSEFCRKILAALEEERYVFSVCKAVRAWLSHLQTAKLVTVHFLYGALMELPGKRVEIDRWIYADLCVVRVRIPAIVIDGDDEESLEPDTLDYLDDLQRKADLGLIDELKKAGDVYVRQSAA